MVIGPGHKILIVKQTGHRLSYSLSKGHLEPGEEPLAAATREIYEEGGISELKLIRTLGRYERPNLFNPNEMKTVFMFLFRTDQIELNSQDPDKDAQPFWAKVDEVKNLLTHPKDKEFYMEHLKEIKNLLPGLVL